MGRKQLHNSGFYSIFKLDNEAYVLCSGSDYHWSNIVQISRNYHETLERYLEFTKVHYLNPSLPLDVFLTEHKQHIMKGERFSSDTNCADGLAQVVLEDCIV